MKRPDPKTLAALALVTLAFALPIPGLWVYQGPPMEEGFMLAFPQRILAGELPHIDFLHLYGPGSLYVLAGVYKVLGSTLGVERGVGIVQHALLIFGMFALARPWGRRAATLAALTSLVITISPLGLSAMAWNGALGLAVLGLALLVRGIDRPGPGILAGAGAAFGAALLYRPDMVVAIGLAALVAWIMVGRSVGSGDSDSDGDGRAQRRWGLVGLVVPLLAYIPFLVAVGPSEAFKGMFLQPVFDLRTGRSLPVPPSWAEPDGYLQKAGGLRVSSWPLPMAGIGPQIAMWFWLVPITIGFVAVVAWWAQRRDRDGLRPRVLAVAAAFDLGLISQALQRPDTAHLLWVTCISFALVPLAIAEIWRARDTGAGRTDADARPGLRLSRPGLRPLFAFVPIGLVLLLVIPFYPLRTYADLVGQSFGRNAFGYPIRRGDRVFYYGSKDAAASAQSVVDALDEQSKPGEKLIVGPVDLSRTPYSDAFFYYLFPELVPGTRYIEMDPGIADAKGSGLAEELEKSDWLIQSDVWTGWTEPNSSATAGDPEPNKVVSRGYCPVVDTGKFRLLHRCKL